MTDKTDELRATERVDQSGRLHVPVAKSMDRTPKREGWEPFFVNIQLNRPTQKVVIYGRTEPTQAS